MDEQNNLSFLVNYLLQDEHIELDAYELSEGKINGFYDDVTFCITYNEDCLLIVSMEHEIVDEIKKSLSTLFGEFSMGYSYYDKDERFPIPKHNAIWFFNNELEQKKFIVNANNLEEDFFITDIVLPEGEKIEDFKYTKEDFDGYLDDQTILEYEAAALTKDRVVERELFHAIDWWVEELYKEASKQNINIEKIKMIGITIERLYQMLEPFDIFVEGNKPGSLKDISEPEAWYMWWRDYLLDLGEKEMNDYFDKWEEELDVSEYYPSGNWVFNLTPEQRRKHIKRVNRKKY